MNEYSDLEKLRDNVKQVTNDIIKLIAKRNDLVVNIGETKSKLGLSTKNIETEEKLKNSMMQICEKYGINIEFGQKILNLLVDESLRLQGEEKQTKQPLMYQLFAEAKRLEAEGKKIIHLEVGEPDYGPPEPVKTAINDALNKGYTRYTTPKGLIELRKKLVDRIKHENGADIDPEQIMMTVGGKFAVYASIMTLLNKGGEGIIVDPAWPVYRVCIARAGGKSIGLKTNLEDDWDLDLEELKEVISPLTKFIFINNPSNPTGKIYSKQTLKGVIDIASEKGIKVISDEVYSHLSFKPFTSVLDIDSTNIIYIQSFSKTYGMTGFRLGYILAERKMIDEMVKLQSATLTSAPEFIQYSAINALTLSEAPQEYMNITKKRVDFACKLMDDLPFSYYRPDGTFYIFPKVETKNTPNLAFDILKQQGVAVAPGASFGDNYKDFLRFSICLEPPLIQEAFDKIRRTIT